MPLKNGQSLAFPLRHDRNQTGKIGNGTEKSRVGTVIGLEYLSSELDTLKDSNS